MTNKTLLFNETTIHYRVTGNGMPVVLLHGFAEDHRVWKHLAPVLAKNYLVLLPDLPGSGGSGYLPDMRMETMADLVHLIIAQEVTGQDEKRAVVMGHSMGGYVALAFADLFPALTRGLGLVHSTAFADTADKKITRQKSIGFIQQHGTAAFLEQSAPNLFTPANRISRQDMVDELIDTYKDMDPRVLVACYEAMVERPDRSALLARLTIPVLFLIGKQDAAVPFADSMRQCHLPEVSFVEILEQSAHMGIWEETTKANLALNNFLSYTANNILQY